jgi:hypothetical protein
MGKVIDMAKARLKRAAEREKEAYNRALKAIIARAKHLDWTKKDKDDE